MILYFSGTGNTRLCAERLASLLGESVRPLSADELRNPGGACIDIPEGDSRLIWAFPTYSWGVPPIVAAIMAKAKFSERTLAARHFMLTTCGDDTGYTDRQWRRILTRRGVCCAGAYAVAMPNTYVLMKGFDDDPQELADKKLAASTARIEHIAEAIKQEKPSELIRGAFPFVKSAIIYPWFRRYAMSPKPFHYTDGCIECGLCARSCPTGNITMAGKHPQWGDVCALCLRCYHICPRHAVAYAKATEGKGQYMCPEK